LIIITLGINDESKRTHIKANEARISISVLYFVSRMIKDAEIRILHIIVSVYIELRECDIQLRVIDMVLVVGDDR
jgi:hypothetical protein